jgi:hypothetical protein
MSRKNKDIEIHGTPTPGHKHDFQYVTHSSFECHSKCECGAVHYHYYSPDGYIGDSPSERIFEHNAKCYNMAGAYKRAIRAIRTVRT